jgi:hypothetical protein
VSGRALCNEAFVSGRRTNVKLNPSAVDLWKQVVTDQWE